MVSTSAAAGASVSSGASVSVSGDRYAALSDLDSIFKVQTSTPSVGQHGSVFSSSNNANNSLGVSSMSSLSSNPSNALSTSSMMSGPNPFTNLGNTVFPSQSNPFQSSSGGIPQSNGFSAGNAGFGATSQSQVQPMNFAGAGMAAMAANQFSKTSGNQQGMFGNTGGLATAGFHAGQGRVSAGGVQLGTSQLGSSQFGVSQFGDSQFGGSQFAGSQFPANQLSGAQGGPTASGQFHSGQFGGGAGMQQQQAFGGIPAGMATNQFGQQYQQQQQLAGAWSQKPQSNPFMVSLIYWQ